MWRTVRRQPWAATDEDDVLIAACRSGHPAAFSAIYDRYFPLIYAYAWRMLDDPLDAEDAAHDAITKAWSRLDTYRPGGFRAWLFAIAHNTIVDQLRTRKRATVPLDDQWSLTSPDSTEQAGLTAVTLSELGALLDTFAPDQRSIVAMKLSGLRHSEIATALGKTEAAVTQDYCRSIRKLSDALGSEPAPAPAGKKGRS